jgi:hypothetical protein
MYFSKNVALSEIQTLGQTPDLVFKRNHLRVFCTGHTSSKIGQHKTFDRLSNVLFHTSATGFVVAKLSLGHPKRALHLWRDLGLAGAAEIFERLANAPLNAGLRGHAAEGR